MNQIGNAVINDETDSHGIFEYAWSHAIISDQLYNNIVKECDSKNQDNQTIASCAIRVRDFLLAYSEIDIYSIYTPICITSPKEAPPKLHVAPHLFTQHVSALHNIMIKN